MLSADLALHVYNGSATTVNIRKVNDQSWTETGLNWNNQPASSTVVGTISSASTGSTTHVDLSNYITADGTYTIELEGTSPDALCIDTKETSTGVAPLLTVVAQK